MNDQRPVLIVDDQEHIRTYLRLVCEKRLGRPVMEAANAETALRLCRQSTPCVVLLDVNMPRVDGMAALPELRALLPTVPIVMLTVRASRTVVQECLEAGASAYLRKDTPIDQIFRVLEKFTRPAPAGDERDVPGGKQEVAKPAAGRCLPAEPSPCLEEVKR
jgi:DNA-binding NarL/FixJ family response regulator